MSWVRFRCWMGAILLVGVGCGQSDSSEPTGPTTEVRFSVGVGDAAFSCTEGYDDFGAGDHRVRISDLRYYVHDVEVVEADGTTRSVSFVDDGAWQLDEVALVDVTDGDGHCLNTPEESNATVELEADPEVVDRAESVAFSVGVPFELNHDDVATAPSPLNIPAMFWNWNAGYKFMRIDLEVGDDSAFRFHLGSTRCQPGADGGVDRCDDPNRPRVVVEGFDADEEGIHLDLERLFAHTDVSRITENTPQGCMSTPDDPDCDGLFNALGIDGQHDESVNDGIFELKQIYGGDGDE